MPLDTTREQLEYTCYQARNTTLAGLVCDHPVLVTESATIDAESINDLWVVDSTAGSVTMTLPPLVDVPMGRSFSFYKLVAANDMVVAGNGAEQIEGAANETRAAQYAVVSVTKVPISATASGWQLEKADLTAGALAPGSVGTVELADDAVTNIKMADDSVDTLELVDGAVTTAKLAADAVDGTKLADDSVDSEHYVDGSIDTIHIAPDAIDGTLIADDVVDSEHYVAGSIDPEHLAAGAVVGAALGGGTRANTVDTAVVLDAADAGTVVTISSTAGAGTRTITVGTLPVGAMVMIVMTAFDTNAYTAAVQGGTVTFDAVGEAGLFFSDGTALRFIATGDVPATFA